MVLSCLVPIGVWMGVVFVLAALGGGGIGARRAGYALGALSTALPWAVPAAFPLVRSTLELAILWSMARYLELTSPVFRASYIRRLWHLVALVDTRLARRVPSRLDARRIALGIAWAAFALAGLFGAITASHSSVAGLAWAGRWVGGLVFLYGFVESGSNLFDAGHRLAGWELPPLHVRPIAARSLGDFWGTRWNRPVSSWIREHLHRPMARRRRLRSALLGSFLWSGLFHAAFTLPALGAAMAASMLGFFCLQALGVFFERSLRLTRRPLLARCFALGFIAVTSPLFTEPALRILAPGHEPVGVAAGRGAVATACSWIGADSSTISTGHAGSASSENGGTS